MMYSQSPVNPSASIGAITFDDTSVNFLNGSILNSTTLPFDSDNKQEDIHCK